MIKTLLIVGGVILFGEFCFIIWVCCKATGDAGGEIEYNYIIEEGWEVI